MKLVLKTKYLLILLVIAFEHLDVGYWINSFENSSHKYSYYFVELFLAVVILLSCIKQREMETNSAIQ
jgi:hypothetical protein